MSFLPNYLEIITLPPLKTETKSVESTPDKIVQSVLDKYISRSKEGMGKFGVSMEDRKRPLDDWLKELQEELMDATLYIEKIRRVLNGA